MDRLVRSCDPSGIALIASAVGRGVAVENFMPVSAKRNADPVVVARHRPKIADKDNRIFSLLAPAQETQHTRFAIVAVDPLEPILFEVTLEKRGLAAVERV